MWRLLLLLLSANSVEASRLILTQSNNVSSIIKINNCTLSVAPAPDGGASIDSSCDLTVNGLSMTQLASDMQAIREFVGMIPPSAPPFSPPSPELPPMLPPASPPMPPIEPTTVRFSNVFKYSGEVQTFTVPDTFNGLLRFKVWGAAGGAGTDKVYGPYHGGSGAFVNVTCSVTAGDKFYIVVGQGGSLGGTSPGVAFGGGGKGGKGYSTGWQGGGGGGLSGIFSASDWTDQDNSLVVAGGGGGASSTWGGDGGGGYPKGGFGTTYDVSGGEPAQAGGQGGTQTAGGAGGTGGRIGGTAEPGSAMKGGEATGSQSSAGGGGGGYYGGGGANGYYAGGGGGSSWTNAKHCSDAKHVSGELGSGVVTQAAKSNGKPTIQSHPAIKAESSKYPTDVAVTSTSGRAGNGLVVVETLEAPMFS